MFWLSIKMKEKAKLFETDDVRQLTGSESREVRLEILSQQMEILKRRAEFLKAFYKKDFPNLLIEQRFMLEEDENGNSQIVELREKVENYSPVIDCPPSGDFFRKGEFEAATLRNFVTSGKYTDSQLRSIATTIRKFTQRSRDLLKTIKDPSAVDFPDGFEDFRGILPDINGYHNLVITSEGDLKMIDTNQCYKLDKSNDDDPLYRYFSNDTESIEYVAVDLEKYLESK